MSSGGCLYYNVIKTAKIMKQCVILGADQSHGDCPSDCCHLDRVGQPVVHHSACGHGGDHLRHVGEAGERGREPNPLQVGPELRFVGRVQPVLLWARPGKPGIHGPHATELARTAFPR